MPNPTLTDVENTESLDKNRVYRLGTRGSLLARLQSESVAVELRRLFPDVQIDIHIIKTTGDHITDRQLHDIGGKGLFTKELEVALLNGEIDFAVHSYKDVPVTMPLVDISQLVITAVPQREDARDVLIAGPTIRSIMQLPTGASVGTGSLRRQCQLLQQRPDLKVVPIRGNIDTRLKKQREGEFDAIILAAAGLRRANLFNSEVMSEIPIDQMVPAAGQGALALQCRSQDQSTQTLLRRRNHVETQTCVDLEREVVRLLNADCNSPLGVYAISLDQQLEIRIAIGNQGSAAVDYKTISAHADSIMHSIKGSLEINSQDD